MEHLANVITEVEKTTSGELRLMIVGRSSRTGHIFPLAFFVIATGSLLYLWYTRHIFILSPNPWLLPVVFAVCGLVAWLLSGLSWIQRRFTPYLDMEAQVWARAELEFHREGLGATQGKTGILIFLSMLEHQAVVLGDKAIAAKLENTVWSDVVKLVLEGARTRRWEEKLEEAIRKCGQLLQQHFPIQPGDKNELPNHVILKD